MTITRDSLRIAYPEFTSAPDALIDAHIDSAALQVDAAVYGDKTDLAILLHACHMIASSQFGERLSLKNDATSTAYKQLFDCITRSAGSSWRMG